MADIIISITVPEAKVPLVQAALNRRYPLLEGETERERAKRFMAEQIRNLVFANQRDSAASAIVKDDGVAG